MTLRVSGLDGRVTLTVPRHVTDIEAMSFAESRGAWLREKVTRAGMPRPVRVGSTIPIEGRQIRIATGIRRGLSGSELIVSPCRAPGPQAAEVLREVARDRMAEAVARHARVLGRKAGRITLRDTRSRWGSCSSRGDLMFSWRLILAPRDVLEYVVVHEVAHLERMDHSAAFWDIVTNLMPGHETARTWLRARGADLHAWDFEPKTAEHG